MNEINETAKSALREQIIDKAVVHGKVILSSGREADYYVDLRRVTLDSQAAPLVGQPVLGALLNMEQLFINKNTATAKSNFFIFLNFKTNIV